jgi:hypothetical protein
LTCIDQRRIQKRGQHQIPAAHIKSFDYFLDKGFGKLVEDLQPVEIEFPENKSFMRVWIRSVNIGQPCHAAFDKPLFPAEVISALLLSLSES